MYCNVVFHTLDMYTYLVLQVWCMIYHCINHGHSLQHHAVGVSQPDVFFVCSALHHHTHHGCCHAGRNRAHMVCVGQSCSCVRDFRCLRGLGCFGEIDCLEFGQFSILSQRCITTCAVELC